MPGKRWTTEEEFLLESLIGEKPIEAIARKLNRRPDAVRVKAHRMGMEITTETNNFSCSLLARLLGLSQCTVQEWIEKGELQAKKRGNGRSCNYRITRANFKKFYEQFYARKYSLKRIPPETIQWLIE